MKTLQEQIDAAVAAHQFGKAAAVKRGRRPEWPYVPIVDHGTHTEQLRGLAYATRAEAVDKAERSIEARKDDLRKKLAEPRYRALREQFGLPRETWWAEEEAYANKCGAAQFSRERFEDPYNKG